MESNMETPKSPKTIIASGWSQEDKYNLLQFLKAHGSHNFKKLCLCFPEKSPWEIRSVLNQYKKIASGVISKPVAIDQNVKSEPKSQIPKPTLPLDAWTKFLTDNIGRDELNTETAVAVRMIAELEDLPETTSADEIDFRSIYHTIADALEGKPLKYNKNTVDVLSMCILETSLSSKAFINSTKLKDMMESIRLGEKDIRVAKPPANEAIALLRSLASQQCYNPLQIPEKYLKPVLGDDIMQDRQTYKKIVQPCAQHKESELPQSCAELKEIELAESCAQLKESVNVIKQ